MYKYAVDRGFADRCKQRGITEQAHIEQLMKVAHGMVSTETETIKKQVEVFKKEAAKRKEAADGKTEAENTEASLKKEALTPEQTYALLGALGGGGLGAGLGGALGGWEGALLGGLGGAGLGAGAGWGGHQLGWLPDLPIFAAAAPSLEEQAAAELAASTISGVDEPVTSPLISGKGLEGGMGVGGGMSEPPKPGVPGAPGAPGGEVAEAPSEEGEKPGATEGGIEGARKATPEDIAKLQAFPRGYARDVNAAMPIAEGMK